MVIITLFYYLHKRLLFALPALVLAMFFPLHLCAQDTLKLQEVEINVEKMQISSLGKKTTQVDSLIKEQFRTLSIADLLNASSTVFIKTYGPGLLSTTAFRGGSASQTGILWNGLNVQNAMLAQVDLSLLPGFLFNKVELEYGGGSTLWGSGAMGGNIRLSSVPKLNTGLQALATVGAGSFGKRSLAGEFIFSGKKFSSSTKLYSLSALNNYDYRETSESQVKQMKHAAYDFKGLMQDLRFFISKKQILSFSAWLGENKRELPGFSGMISRAGQNDRTARLMGAWEFDIYRYKSQIRAGIFKEEIDYNDSTSMLFSRSQVQTLIAENEHFYLWSHGQQLNVGVNYTGSFASTENYRGPQKTERISLLAGNRSTFLKTKLVLYAAARLEYFSAGNLPFTWNLSGEYKLNPLLTLQANLVRVYRQPSLNELYWLPGGNSKLKAEEGITAEGNIVYKKNKMPFFIQVDLSAFSRSIDNWILWLPGAEGNPSPSNIQKVWSRGTESSFAFRVKKAGFFAGLSFMSSYVLSTVVKDQMDNSSSLGRQLIYTPRYSGNIQAQAGFKTLNIVYLQQYTGYRFTSSDNRNWLDPYHLSSLRLNLVQEFKKQSFTLSLACNNLFNSTYYSLVGRPMPLRYYEASMTLHFIHKKSNHTQP